MKITEIEKLNQLVSRTDMAGNEKVQWLTNFIDNHVTEQLNIGAVNGCDSIKTTWDIRECFKQLRFDKNHHLGLGDIRLTIAQQE